ncbi:rhamnulokinase [Pseudonocardia lacus]|uniref:rhamnulokinase n=1 Tax=Pseudonocardia lacus TaxID=2835865 RepID=UPI001BDDBFFB|nr:rhamnulokinase family protein [Pseudonocardia lacus]
MPAYLAVDLGAESGRVLRGDFDGARLVVEEVHRFPNTPVRGPDDLCWDFDALLRAVVEGIARGAGADVRSVGVDAWGNDFGLLDARGDLVAPPWHHRTPRTADAVARLLGRVDADEVYAITGTQFLPITTACQLLAMRGSPALARAEALATIPDLVAARLSGVRVTERTIASTGQLWDIRRGRWASGLIERLGLDGGLFDAEVVDPATPLGPLTGEVARQVDAPAPPGVVAVAGHDTASAVAAVPAGDDLGPDGLFGYVSCGTWSLVGLEVPHPITTPRARRARFTNEAGVAGTVRFLSNVNGLWLLQECRRAWRTNGAGPSYPELTELAGRAPAWRSLVDPDDPSLLGAGDMPGRIARLCRATGEPVPRDRGEFVRCVLDSLACKYRWVLDRAAELVGRPVPVVHLVGGGAANALLCRLTADTCGRPVVAGPLEATGVGNLLVQAVADGQLDGVADIREVVRASFRPRTYHPGVHPAALDDACGRFGLLVERGAAAAADAIG